MRFHQGRGKPDTGGVVRRDGVVNSPLHYVVGSIDEDAGGTISGTYQIRLTTSPLGRASFPAPCSPEGATPARCRCHRFGEENCKAKTRQFDRSPISKPRRKCVMREKRRYFREKLLQPARIEFDNKEPSGFISHGSYDAFIVDLSMNGAYLLSPVAVDPGRRIALEIRSQNGLPGFRLPAKVVRCTRRDKNDAVPFGIAIQLEEDRRELAALLAQHILELYRTVLQSHMN